MQKLGISRRTVYYDMEKINDWLKTIHLPPVEYVRAAGYYLPDESRKGIPQLAGQLPVQQYYLSPRERLAWLAVHLLSPADGSLFVHHLTDLLQVSRGTVLKDLNIVRPELESLKLKVAYDRKQGYRVRGKRATSGRRSRTTSGRSSEAWAGSRRSAGAKTRAVLTRCWTYSLR